MYIYLRGELRDLRPRVGERGRVVQYIYLSIYIYLYVLDGWIDGQIKRNIIDYLCRELGNLRP